MSENTPNNKRLLDFLVSPIVLILKGAETQVPVGCPQTPLTATDDAAANFVCPDHRHDLASCSAVLRSIRLSLLSHALQQQQPVTRKIGSVFLWQEPER
jgi:hypothetical protein